MERRTLDITLIAAKGLKNPNLFSKSDIYAVVHIAGADSQPKFKTPVDREGNKNPNWNFPMKFTLDEAALQHNRLTLVVDLRAERVLGDKDVGQVTVPMKDLFGDHKSIQFVRYQVRKPSGRPKGELNFSYKFGEKVSVAGAQVAEIVDEPVTAYPVAAGPSTVYPPPPSGYPQSAYPQSGPGYGYPPQSVYSQPGAVAGYGYPAHQAAGYPPPQQMGQGYGYPPQQYGYGGYPPVQQPPKKNKFGGAGLGMGLLGGALGGLLIGDMISDAGSGFDDMGGFDF